MMNCAYCLHTHSAHAHFCAHCGEPIKANQDNDSSNAMAQAFQTPAGEVRELSPQAIPPNTQREKGMAGFWLRALAFMVDASILAVVYVLLWVGILIAFIMTPGDRFLHLSLAGHALFLIIAWLYSASLESGRTRATWGKRIFSLEVANINGEQMSFWRASVRHWGKFISTAFFGLGFLMTVWTRRKQALHDILAQTVVYEKNMAATLFAPAVAPNASSSAVDALSAKNQWRWLIALSVGILAVFVGLIVALGWAYQGYALRQQVNEVVDTGWHLTECVDAYINEFEEWPDELSTLSEVCEEGLYHPAMSHIEWQEAVADETPDTVTVVLHHALKPLAYKKIQFVYVDEQWVCFSEDIADYYLPPRCHSSLSD